MPGVGDNPFLMLQFQGLGRFDDEITSLCAIVADGMGLVDPDDDPIALSLALDRAIRYSRLWVLDAYELMRILKNAEPERFDPVYERLRSVRVPLAKYERARDRSGVTTLALPGVHPDTGEVAWRLESGEWISRAELVDAVLSSTA